MPKVTSKLQLTVPKAIADQYGIRPGDELEWTPAGDVIRVVPARGRKILEHALTVEERLRLFDAASARQAKRNAARKKNSGEERSPKERGWKREDLYNRGRSR
jgi:AbrB family looped-hinge helix DNA binding protein